ncbi:MAG TPA: DUF5522 domain-containing protein [Nitriliruptorales bacterium]
MTELPPELIAPHPDRLAPDHPRYDQIVAAHAAAVARGEDGYPDPGTGYWVFSALALWERGTCCEQGCRHCPWIARSV